MKALTSPPHEVIRRAWNRWLKTTMLDEFNRVHTIKGQTGKGKRKMTAVAGRRAAIVEALTACPTHEWIAFDDDLDCLSRYDGLLYIRINGLGAWCLGLTEEYVPSPLDVQQVLKVLPNMEVVATEPLPPGDILFLEQFAEQASDVVWKIQPIRLLEALEAGHPVADMEAFLKARAGGNLPDNVVIFFREMADRASRLADRGPARVIEAQDAALAQLIVSDSRLRSLCMLAGERYIVVPADNESAFRRGLRELGYGLPASQGSGWQSRG